MSKRDAVYSQVDTLTRELESIRARITELDELDEARADVEQLTEEKASRLVASMEAIAALSRERDEVQGERNHLYSANEDLRATCDQLRIINERLMKNLDAAIAKSGEFEDAWGEALAELDPPECRQQIGRDGLVPVNARDGMRMWKLEAEMRLEDNKQLITEVNRLRQDLGQAKCRVGSIANALERSNAKTEDLRAKLYQWEALADHGIDNPAAVLTISEHAEHQRQRAEKAENKLADSEENFRNAVDDIEAYKVREKGLKRNIVAVDELRSRAWCRASTLETREKKLLELLQEAQTWMENGEASKKLAQDIKNILMRPVE